jgi:hypothetical protein
MLRFYHNKVNEHDQMWETGIWKISMKMTKKIENEYLETLMKMTKMKQMGIWKP